MHSYEKRQPKWLSKKVGGEAQNLGGDFGGESVLSLGETLGERP